MFKLTVDYYYNTNVFMSGNCIPVEEMMLGTSEITKVMSCQDNLCNRPSFILPKLSKAILCSNGFYA
jgi:hypothetical protein